MAHREALIVVCGDGACLMPAIIFMDQQGFPLRAGQAATFDYPTYPGAGALDNPHILLEEVGVYVGVHGVKHIFLTVHDGCAKVPDPVEQELRLMALFEMVCTHFADTSVETVTALRLKDGFSVEMLRHNAIKREHAVGE